MQRKIIKVIDDEKMFLDFAVSILKKEFPETIIETYIDLHNEKIFENLEHCDLIITDIKLKHGEDGRDLCTYVAEHDMLHVPFLFVSGFDYHYSTFSDEPCIYDFIQKPFETRIFINRVKLLLRVSAYNKLKLNILDLKNLNIWNLLNYTNMYVLLLDKDANILMSNFFLSTSLGFSSQEQMIGLNWLQFIPEEQKEQVLIVHKNVLDTVETHDCKFSEFSNDIQTLEGKIYPVKWFNACVNNNSNCTFSIGIPLQRTINSYENIESMRAYWRDIIQQDRTLIQSIKELLGRTTHNA